MKNYKLYMETTKKLFDICMLSINNIFLMEELYKKEPNLFKTIFNKLNEISDKKIENGSNIVDSMIYFRTNLNFKMLLKLDENFADSYIENIIKSYSKFHKGSYITNFKEILKYFPEKIKYIEKEVFSYKERKEKIGDEIMLQVLFSLYDIQKDSYKNISNNIELEKKLWNQ